MKWILYTFLLVSNVDIYSHEFWVLLITLFNHYETRSDREFLYQILEEVIKAGASTLGIGDTVGITMPFEIRQLIADIKANVPGAENVIISMHCHNDLGHATANAIEVYT